jgi:acyl carrier protein
METTTTTLIKLQNVVEKLTGNTITGVDIHGSIRSQLALDSMQFVQLFTALEEEFSTELPLSLMNAATVDELVKIIESCTAEPA